MSLKELEAKLIVWEQRLRSDVGEILCQAGQALPDGVSLAFLHSPQQRLADEVIRLPHAQTQLDTYTRDFAAFLDAHPGQEDTFLRWINALITYFNHIQSPERRLGEDLPNPTVGDMRYILQIPLTPTENRQQLYGEVRKLGHTGFTVLSKIFLAQNATS